MTLTVRGRYAPSPSGRLHLGNARTALLSWLQVRACGGVYVMRVEDLDPQRCRPEHEARMLEDLRWLGIDWDEGPDVGGEFGPYRQSECAELYAAAAEGLETYPCTCTRRELAEAVRAPHGTTIVYPGTCAQGPTHPERPPALRVRVPEGARVEVQDLIAGPLVQDIHGEVGDFAIRRSDGAWAYQLAVVVDDARMQVSHVLRGADLLESTPRQCWLQAQLGFARPVYAHAPLVLGPDGNKLNKRHGAPDLCALREGGADAHRVLAALAHSAGLLPESTAAVSPQDLLAIYAQGPGLDAVRSGARSLPMGDWDLVPGHSDA